MALLASLSDIGLSRFEMRGFGAGAHFGPASP
jgi:hypothetical protein